MDTTKQIRKQTVNQSFELPRIIENPLIFDLNVDNLNQCRNLLFEILGDFDKYK